MEGLEACDAGGRRLDFAAGSRSRGVDEEYNLDASHLMERGEWMEIENFLLEKDEAVLVIIDIQERLATVMGMREQVVRNTTHLIELAKMLKIPIIVTEQYPKGLGRTLPELRTVLPEYTPVEKTAFNCCGEPSLYYGDKEISKKEGDHYRHGDAYMRAPDLRRADQGRVCTAI